MRLLVLKQIFGDQGIRGKLHGAAFSPRFCYGIQHECMSLSRSKFDQVKKNIKLPESEGVAFDIGAYRDVRSARVKSLVRRHNREIRRRIINRMAGMGLRFYR